MNTFRGLLSLLARLMIATIHNGTQAKNQLMIGATNTVPVRRCQPRIAP